MSKSVRRRGFPVRGELLRSLRRERGWTQEEAAHRAQVSEKLFRKAEQGGRVDGRSLAALASIFSGDSRRPFCSQDLLGVEAEPATVAGQASRPAEELAPETPSEACRLVEKWLRAIWERHAFDAVDRWGAPMMVLHCEVGILRGIEAIRRRYKRLCADTNPASLTVDALKGTGDSAVCRWTARRPLAEPGDQATGLGIFIGGATAIRLEGAKILEVSEFLDSRHHYQQLVSGLTSRSAGEVARKG